jgi:nucleotide-binding universal stress UspA family protein
MARGNGPEVSWPSTGARPPSPNEDWLQASTIPLDTPVTPRLETILLATDGSPASEPASDQAIDLATQVGARLLVVSVLASSRQPSEASTGASHPSDTRDSLASNAQAIVQRARAAGANATFLVWEGDPGEAIVAAADSECADLIVVGSHGRSGVSRFLIGSVSDFVVRNAHCPVMVVRARTEVSARR